MVVTAVGRSLRPVGVSPCVVTLAGVDGDLDGGRAIDGTAEVVLFMKRFFSYFSYDGVVRMEYDESPDNSL